MGGFSTTTPPAAGHNNPPADDPIDAALAEYGDVIAEAEGWLDGVKVESEGQMRAVDALAKQIRASWDETFDILGHEAQRRAVERLQVPVTSLMTVKQMSAFLDAMQRHWLPLGIRLTDPEALKYEEEFR